MLVNGQIACLNNGRVKDPQAAHAGGESYLGSKGASVCRWKEEAICRTVVSDGLGLAE